MNNTENDENFKRYNERLSSLHKESVLTPPPELPIDQLISYLAAEGAKLLAAEERLKAKSKMPDDTARLTTTLAANSKNPYIRARNMVLAKMSPAKKKELDEMEKSGNVNNTIYDKFVAEVVRIGTELENKK